MATDLEARVRTAATAGSRLSCRSASHDVWAAHLPRPRPGITLEGFCRQQAGASPMVCALLDVNKALYKLAEPPKPPANANTS